MQSNIGQRAFHNKRLEKQRKELRKQADDALAAAFGAYGAGKHAEAQAVCSKVLEVFPDDFNALHLAGLSNSDCGRLTEAEALLQKAARVSPNNAEVHSNLGVALAKMGQLEDARQSYLRAIALKPDYPVALNNLANALSRLRRPEEAIGCYDKTIALQPNYADAYLNRGMAWLVLNRLADADADFDRALALRAGYPAAILGKGLVKLEQRHVTEAIAIFDAVIAAHPMAEAFAYRGRARVQSAEFDAAAEDFDAALRANPALVQAWQGKAQVSLFKNRTPEALAACEQALRLDPASEPALCLLGNCLAQAGRTAEAIASFDRALAIRPNYEDAITRKIFTLDFVEGADFAVLQAARRYWWDQIGSKLPRRQLKSRPIDPDRRITVGYVSSDFRHHSAALTFRPVLQHHDAARFKVVCYSCSPLCDHVTTEFRQIAHQWVDAAQMSDDELADRIEADQVDILVDLSGHSAGNRLAVFARKPAPIQVTAWGHPTGTGMPMIDYVFSDPVTIPTTDRRHFAEAIYDLPALLTLEPIEGLEPSAPPMLRNGFVTFGVFNRIDKISPSALSLWARLLKALPTSRIVIKHGALDQAYLREGLIGRFVNQGIAPDRIEAIGQTSRGEHLKAFEKIDIALDPFPQTGGVSTWESLQMGVPVVTKLGRGVSARTAGGIVASIGLSGWIAATDDAYLSIVANFAAMPEHLARLRRDLPTTIAASPSGNPEMYTRAVEQAYRAFWTKWCVGKGLPQ